MSDNKGSISRVTEFGGREATVLEHDSIRVMIDDIGGMTPELSGVKDGNWLNAHWMPWFRSSSGKQYNEDEHGSFWKANLLYQLAGKFRLPSQLRPRPYRRRHTHAPPRLVGKPGMALRYPRYRPGERRRLGPFGDGKPRKGHAPFIQQNRRDYSRPEYSLYQHSGAQPRLPGHGHYRRVAQCRRRPLPFAGL